MYKRHLYRCGMLSLECNFSEQWVLIIFGIVTSYHHLFAFYNHHQSPPKWIFLNEWEWFYFQAFAFIFTLFENHPEGAYQPIQLLVLKNSELSVLLFAFFFPWCGYVKISPATENNLERQKKIRVRDVSIRNLQSG